MFCTLLLAGCSEFPCVADRTDADTVGPIEFTYEQQTRYTYWFEDGAQRVVFDREEVPSAARAAVVVHIPEQTSGELHGSVGWVADVRGAESTVANLMPMALARAAAHDSWAGDWTARWLKTRAGLLSSDLSHQKALEAQLAAVNEEESGPVSPNTGTTGKNTTAEPAPPPTTPAAPSLLQKTLDEEGISLDELKRDRALRVVGAQQPRPSDFGLSQDLDIHRVWLFVEEDCTACDMAMTFLENKGIAFHTMRVSDPTNARTLRDLAMKADRKPVVPTAWSSPSMLGGFSPGTWNQHFD